AGRFSFYRAAGGERAAGKILYGAQNWQRAADQTRAAPFLCKLSARARWQHRQTASQYWPHERGDHLPALPPRCVAARGESVLERSPTKRLGRESCRDGSDLTFATG